MTVAELIARLSLMSPNDIVLFQSRDSLITDVLLVEHEQLPWGLDDLADVVVLR